MYNSMPVSSYIKLDGVPVANCFSLRGKELKKLNIEWEEPEELFSLRAREGWRIMRLHTPRDTAILGTIMGHCSGGHPGLVCEEAIWHFLTLFDEHNAPHATIHLMNGTWYQIPHSECPVPTEKRYTASYSHVGYGTNVLDEWPNLVQLGSHGEAGILSMSAKGDYTAEKYKPDIKEWYDANDTGKPVPSIGLDSHY